jgi:hypothetical protein
MLASSLCPTAYRCALGLVVVGSIGLAVGCSGDKRQNVTGVVTLDGQPLGEGVVQFLGPGDRLSTARIQPDGTFVATDLVPGDSIQVAVIDDPERAMARLGKPQAKADMPPVDQGPAPAKAVAIPKKYKDFKTSGLSYTISPETPTVEVKLLSK